MITHYTLENKPAFKNGELVMVDMECFGFPPEIREGEIVGKATTNIIDTWLIRFGKEFGPTYPYNVVVVQHTFIVDPTHTDDYELYHGGWRKNKHLETCNECNSKGTVLKTNGWLLFDGKCKHCNGTGKE